MTQLDTARGPIDSADLGVTLMHELPNWHYLHIHNGVLPVRRARGVTEEEQIGTMLVGNPRAIFANRATY
jgi:phosphotriesterase-related protein